ncbi:MAG: hypothetical protein P4L51_27395 [Puia sp.]|nr:hypothetical protein [Puia sp.]
MKKIFGNIHLGENARTALLAIGFLSLVMILSYLFFTSSVNG